jgi:DNA-directed RNA polymerase specialized sigma24 family protein
MGTLRQQQRTALGLQALGLTYKEICTRTGMCLW